MRSTAFFSVAARSAASIVGVVAEAAKAGLRQRVTERTSEPFRGLTDIVPAALGEEVVVHGALALARQKFVG